MKLQKNKLALLGSGKRLIFLMLLTLAMFIFSGCQHKSDETNVDSDNETGELSIELTDAKGDFTNYTVDVLSLSLTKKNGTLVEVLPESTRVDFSQYVEMSEFLTLATVPKGIYTSATLHLDYQNAEIFVEDEDGNSIQVSNIVDENNEALTTLDANVSLEERNQLLIVPGVPAFLSLDFDLKTSNSVSFDDANIPSVTVSPALNASLEPELNKTHRVRGPLKSVNIDNASFDLIIRPFRNKINNNSHERFGKLKVTTTDETLFEINDESFTGSDGITVMDDLDKLTAIIVLGDISLKPRRFVATEVYAGSSVPGGELDVIKGSILSRDDNTLLVRGATLIRSGGSVLFNDSVTVTIADTTIVKKQKDDADYNIDSISVGQAVTIFGDLGDDLANPTLDASNGLVRMRITSLSGSVVDSDTEVDATFFEVNLNKINGRKTEKYDFSGTGTDIDNDADPEFYEIDTGVLDISKFPLQSPVKFRGFVSAFGTAPADFLASSIIGMKSVKATMHTNWRPFSNTAFSQISSSIVVLDFTGSGKFHHLGRGHQRIDLTELGTDFSLVPNAENEGMYIIHLTGPKHVHSTFDNFAADLQDQLDAGGLVKRIQSKGTFDVATGNFMVDAIRLHMQ